MNLGTRRSKSSPHLVTALAVLGLGLWLRLPLQADDKAQKTAPVLEFRIVANAKDDTEALPAAKAYFEDDKHKDERTRRAREGLPPPPISGKGHATYSWVEVARSEQLSLNLNNEAENPWENLLLHVRNHWPKVKAADLAAIELEKDEVLIDFLQKQTKTPREEIEAFINGNKNRGENWKRAAEARGKAVVLESMKCLLYSRSCVNTHLTPQERAEKKVDYFLLLRDPEKGKELTGKEFERVRKEVDERKNLMVSFRLTERGGKLMYELTSKNSPTGPEGDQFYRFLAIILDGRIRTAPRISTALRREGQISGNFTDDEVDRLVKLLSADKSSDDK